ncbi:MAG: glycosyltransferase family 2 protein [Verrucomicrobia bacterium]|nr:glycosyltransferase family 2 protein [Verrucomicrobiota bacterium]
MSFLSVIIVAWRSREEIMACVRSIPCEMGGRSVEVIVVDNSLNADGTGDWLRREAPQVRYLLPSENLGFGRGNNLGFSESTGGCVLFLNPDTICNEVALAHCVARVRSELDIGLISPKLVLADGSMDLACRRSIPTIWDGLCRGSGLAARFPKTKMFSGYNLTHLPEEGTYEVGAINGAFMLGRREVFEKLAEPRPHGIFDEQFFMYGDDLDLCIRVVRAGYKIVYDGRVKITHLKGQSVAKDYERMAVAIFDANRDVYLKNFNPHGSWMVRWKYTATFGLWKRVALLRAKLRGHRKVRPV